MGGKLMSAESELYLWTLWYQWQLRLSWMEQIITEELRKNLNSGFSNAHGSVHTGKKKTKQKNHMYSDVLSGPRCEDTMYIWKKTSWRTLKKHLSLCYTWRKRALMCNILMYYYTLFAEQWPLLSSPSLQTDCRKLQLWRRWDTFQWGGLADRIHKAVATKI